MSRQATRVAIRLDPLTDWYEIWLAEHGARARREAADRAAMERELRWLTWLLIGWAAAAALGGITVLVAWARL